MSDIIGLKLALNCILSVFSADFLQIEINLKKLIKVLSKYLTKLFHCDKLILIPTLRKSCVLRSVGHL